MGNNSTEIVEEVRNSVYLHADNCSIFLKDEDCVGMIDEFRKGFDVLINETIDKFSTEQKESFLWSKFEEHKIFNSFKNTFLTLKTH